MPKFKVTLEWMLPSRVDVEVEADNEEEAAKRALEQEEDDDLYFEATEYPEDREGPRVENVEEVK